METSQGLGTWQQSSGPCRRGRPPGPACRACSTPPSASSLVRPSLPPKPSWSGQLLATASLKIGKSNCRWSGEAIVAEHRPILRSADATRPAVPNPRALAFEGQCLLLVRDWLQECTDQAP